MGIDSKRQQYSSVSEIFCAVKLLGNKLFIASVLLCLTVGFPEANIRLRLNNTTTPPNLPPPARTDTLASLLTLNENTSFSLSSARLESTRLRTAWTPSCQRRTETWTGASRTVLSEHKVFQRRVRPAKLSMNPLVTYLAVIHRRDDTVNSPNLNRKYRKRAKKKKNDNKKKKNNSSRNRLWYCLYVIYSYMIISKRSDHWTLTSGAVL